jgi:hypothetical protein
VSSRSPAPERSRTQLQHFGRSSEIETQKQSELRSRCTPLGYHHKTPFRLSSLLSVEAIGCECVTLHKSLYHCHGLDELMVTTSFILNVGVHTMKQMQKERPDLADWWMGKVSQHPASNLAVLINATVLSVLCGADDHLFHRSS